MNRHDIIVIGAGLGGLVAAAYLCKEGRRTLVLERLNCLGGRFRNIYYKGFQLSTGALHLIPHRRGPMTKMIKDLQLEELGVGLLDTGKIHLLGRDGSICELGDSDILKVFLTAPFSEDSRRKLDAFLKFSIGLSLKETPLCTLIKYLLAVRKYGRPAISRGGCSTIIDALARRIEKNGGNIKKKIEVKRVLVNDKGEVTGVETENEKGKRTFFKSNVVISNVGPEGTACLLDDNWRARLNLKPSHPVAGIKINVSCSDAPFEHPLIITPYCERISAIVTASLVDRGLAPKGKHLLMAYQKNVSGEIRKDILCGLRDLRNIIPNFDRNCEVLLAQAFKGAWPVNRSPQGREYRHVLKPIKNLYLVGDSVKPHDMTKEHIMTEGIVEGVHKVVKHILSK